MARNRGHVLIGRILPLSYFPSQLQLFPTPAAANETKRIYRATYALYLNGAVLDLLLNIITTSPVEIEYCSTQLVDHVLRLSESPSIENRLLVIRLLYSIVEISDPNLAHFMPSILNCVFRHTTDADDSVVLECCEFWIVFGTVPHCLKFMNQDMLNQLVPVLLEKMKYSKDDPTLHDVNATTNEPDKMDDIQPFVSKRGNQEADEEENFGEDFEFHGRSCDGLSWTVRKCAAAALDQLSNMFSSRLFNALLPAVQSMLSEQCDWITKEAAILALGAVANGCMDSINSHLPGLIPYLLKFTDDQAPLVRSITCWTIGRYGNWIITESEMIDRVLEKILIRMVDQNKRVQEAACSTLANLEDDVPKAMLAMFAEPILKAINEAFGLYQSRNLLILYDTLSGFCDCLSEDLRHPQIEHAIMRPLMEKYRTVQDSDPMIFSLFECLGVVAVAFRDHFNQYAPPIIHRCVSIIESHLDGDEVNYIVVPLNLLSSITGAIGSIGGVLEDSVRSLRLIEFMPRLLTHSSADVRQSSFALLGDLVKHAFGLFCHCLQPVTQICCDCIKSQPSSIPVCNNVMWALGEIVKHIGQAELDQVAAHLQLMISSIIGPIVQILNTNSRSKHVFDNTTITILHIAYVWPSLISPILNTIIENVCKALNRISSENEKDLAIMGLLKAVRLNGNVVGVHMTSLCSAVLSTQNKRVRDMMIELFKDLQRTVDSETWAQAILGLTPEVKTQVQAMFSS
ncbi:hypothetical protein ACOME3_009444 [Neoechinorhynchus agilis]